MKFNIYGVVPGLSLSESLQILEKIGPVCSEERTEGDPYLEVSVREPGSEDEFGLFEDRCSILVRRESGLVTQVSGDRLFCGSDQVLSVQDPIEKLHKVTGQTVSKVRGREFFAVELERTSEHTQDLVIVADDGLVTSISIGFDLYRDRSNVNRNFDLRPG